MVEKKIVYEDNINKETITTSAGFVEESLEKLGCPMNIVTKIMIATDEIVSNIVNYSGGTKLTIVIEETSNRIEITYMDDGTEFNPCLEKEPDTTLSAKDREIGGLGLHLVRNLMDGVSYKYEDGQNRLSIEKTKQ